MAQRDIGEQNKTDYSNFEAGYFNQLNLGSKSALQSVAPAATDIDVAGYTKQPSISRASLGLDMTELDRATPLPPPGYAPGPLAQVNLDYENSTLFKIGSVLSSYGEKIPAYMKLRMAQQETADKLNQTKLAYDNYYRLNKTVRDAAAQHSNEMKFKAMEMATNFKGRVASITDPIQRKEAGEFYGDYLDSMSPGSGKVLRFMGTDPAKILGFDATMADPEFGKSLRELTVNMDPNDIAVNPQVHALIDMKGHDLIGIVASRIPHEKMEQIRTSKISQPEFEKLFYEALLDPSFKAQPIDHAFAKYALQTPYGEKVMAGLGVILNKNVVELGKKVGSAGSGLDAEKFKRFKANEAKIGLEETNPGTFTSEEIAQFQEENRTFLKLQAPQSSPGESRSNLYSKKLFDLSGARYATDEDILSKTKAGTPERAEALQLAAQATNFAATYAPKGQMDVKLAAPGDTTDYIDIEQLRKTGKAVGIKESVSAGELLTNKKKYAKASPDQKKQLSDLNVSQVSSHQIFDEAAKAFTGSPTAEAAADTILRKEDSVLNAPLKAVAKANFPKLAIYVARREATLGKFARSISGEMGVLTDQDVVRVRNLFPVGGDTKQIRDAKRKSLDALVNLNRRFAIEVLSGELLPEDIAALKMSDSYRSAVNGILGSVEGLSSPAETQPAVKDRSRTESLLERMQKEQKGQ